LTGIYQRHCAKTGESEGKGLERFGSPALFLLFETADAIAIERALERDYFMTGSFVCVDDRCHQPNLFFCHSSRSFRLWDSRWDFRETTEIGKC
jgi:hypothetical protein